MTPYEVTAGPLREMGYSPMPVAPGTKIPGACGDGTWRPMPAWQKYCATPAPSFMHQAWCNWPDAGVCIAHGDVIGLDIDTDRADVAEAVRGAVPLSEVRRVGRKGYMAYYRPAPDLSAETARLRWHDADGGVVVELLLRGTQSVVPPTIHPDTGQPYRWTGEALTEVALRDLPVFRAADLAAMTTALERIGVTRKAPRKAVLSDYGRADPGAPDLEKPFGRSLNDRAMQAIDLWWPALDMPKSRQRGPGAWEAVPFWRASNSGRPVNDRNPNLKAIPGGIVDFGADRSYTPADLVMAARECSFMAAAEWLEQFVRPEDVQVMELAAPAVVTPFTPGKMKSPLARMVQRGDGARAPIKAAEPASDAEFDAEFPSEVPPFPIRDFERDLTGTLRDLTMHIDAGSRTRSEQGAFAAALGLLSALLGGKVEFNEGGVGLRTNMYVIGTSASGAGKSSAVNAMMRAATEFGVGDVIAGSDFTSGAAILNELGLGSRPRLFCIDEFGDVLSRVLGSRAATHERDIRRILKDLYSASAGVYHGKSKASEERKDYVEPHVCICGVSTYEAMWEGLDAASLKDGLLARMLVIPIGETEAQTPSRVRYDEVREGITAIRQHVEPGNTGMGVRVVATAHGVMDAYRADWARNFALAKRAEMRDLPGAPAMIARISENAMKIATVSAAARSIEEPIMTMDDYVVGYSVAHWSVISMIDAVGRYYVESETHRTLLRVIDAVASRGAGGMTRSELTNALKSAPIRDRDEAIRTALEIGKVVEMRPDIGPKGGRPKVIYIAAEHAKEKDHDATQATDG